MAYLWGEGTGPWPFGLNCFYLLPYLLVAPLRVTRLYPPLPNPRYDTCVFYRTTKRHTFQSPPPRKTCSLQRHIGFSRKHSASRCNFCAKSIRNGSKRIRTRVLSIESPRHRVPWRNIMFCITYEYCLLVYMLLLCID